MITCTILTIVVVNYNVNVIKSSAIISYFNYTIVYIIIKEISIVERMTLTLPYDLHVRV